MEFCLSPYNYYRSCCGRTADCHHRSLPPSDGTEGLWHCFNLSFSSPLDKNLHLNQILPRLSYLSEWFGCYSSPNLYLQDFVTVHFSVIISFQFVVPPKYFTWKSHGLTKHKLFLNVSPIIAFALNFLGQDLLSAGTLAYYSTLTMINKK